MEGFHVGPFYFYTWGLTAAAGVFMAIWMALRKIKSQKPKTKNWISENQFWNLAILLVASVFLGSRVLYIFEAWDYYASDPGAILRLWEGGFSFFGGAIGAVLSGYYWSKKYKVDFWYLGYLFTPAWIFGMFFGRIGCFLIHDHLGKITTPPWGVWVKGTYRYEPAGYEAMWLLIIGIILYFVDRKASVDNLNLKFQIQVPNKIQNHKSELGTENWKLIGNLLYTLFPISLLLYSIARFFTDFTRADDPLYYGLTVAQWLCLIIFIWLITQIKKVSKKKETVD